VTAWRDGVFTAKTKGEKKLDGFGAGAAGVILEAVGDSVLAGRGQEKVGNGDVDSDYGIWSYVGVYERGFVELD